MTTTVEVKVPDIGDFKDIPIIEVFVKAGDTVKAEDPLISLESDKATMEVPSPVDGVVKDIKVKLGDKVSEGSLILTVDADAAPAAVQLARRKRQPVHSVERDRACVRVEEAEDEARRGALPRARFPHEPERLAFVHGERHAVDGFHRAPARDDVGA